MIDPTQAAGQPPANDEPQGTICIAPQPDGTFMVYPDGQQDQGQPAQDIDGALEAARQLLGGAQDPKAADAQADQLFQAGFNGTAPSGQQG